MALVRVRAIADFEHRGASYHAGELIDLEPVEAVVLHRKRKVSLTRALAPDPPRDVRLQDKARFADTLTVSIGDAIQAAPTDEDAAIPKRRRRRTRVEE